MPQQKAKSQSATTDPQSAPPLPPHASGLPSLPENPPVEAEKPKVETGPVGEASRQNPVKRRWTRSAEGRAVITLDDHDDDGNYAYIDIEPYGDPESREYRVHPVSHSDGQHVDVEVNGEWKRARVERSTLTVREHVA